MKQAAQRLDQAVAKLEAASRRLGDGKRGAKAKPGSSDDAALVAARLDEAILRIDRLLEG
jgi:hypothetical protein